MKNLKIGKTENGVHCAYEFPDGLRTIIITDSTFLSKGSYKIDDSIKYGIVFHPSTRMEDLNKSSSCIYSDEKERDAEYDKIVNVIRTLKAINQG